jgi:hypothetical protein
MEERARGEEAKKIYNQGGSMANATPDELQIDKWHQEKADDPIRAMRWLFQVLEENNCTSEKMWIAITNMKMLWRTSQFSSDERENIFFHAGVLIANILPKISPHDRKEWIVEEVFVEFNRLAIHKTPKFTELLEQQPAHRLEPILQFLSPSAKKMVIDSLKDTNRDIDILEKEELSAQLAFYIFEIKNNLNPNIQKWGGIFGAKIFSSREQAASEGLISSLDEVTFILADPYSVTKDQYEKAIYKLIDLVAQYKNSINDASLEFVRRCDKFLTKPDIVIILEKTHTPRSKHSL